MRLESFQITGFKSIERNAKVLFSSENVTVIYGDNGCGKTTFLKAINSFLAQDDAGLAGLEIETITCVVSEDEKVNSITVRRQEGGYDWREFESSFLMKSSSLSLGVERGVSTQTMKIEPEVLVDFFLHSKRAAALFNEDRPLAASFHRRRLMEMAEDLSMFLRRRQLSRFRNRRPEI